MNNKTLLIIVIVLLVIFAVVKFYTSVKSESTMNTNLVDIDTAKITEIRIYPTSENRNEIRLFKEGKTWKVSKDKITAAAEPNAAPGLISLLMEIKPQRLATRDKSKWNEFHVSDTMATRVKVYEGKDNTLDLMIGKFTYKQSNNPYGGMYGNGGITGTSFVRLFDEDEVYAVEGFLTFSFNQQFNNFRDQTLLRIDKSTLKSITFKYPADSSFSLVKDGNKWMMGGTEPDSTKVEEFLGSIAYKNAQSFNDNFVPSGAPVFQVILDTDKKGQITINAYPGLGTGYIINSSVNPKSYFSTVNNGLLGEIFKSPKSFIKEKKKKK